MDRRQSPSRAGFTLVEVLVAILIIATLIAILLPAIFGALRTAREAQVTAELNNMATALASFKLTYGDYPPSRIILSEEGFTATLLRSEFTAGTAIPVDTNSGDTSVSTDITFSQLAQRSLLYLRKFWGRVDFYGSNGFDFNNNGSPDGYYILSGSECLTFFLGGIPMATGQGTFALTGFSKLPQTPFAAANPSANFATNRTVQNYEFNIGRLIDTDGDGIPSYMDPLDVANPRAYAYFSSYGTNSYDPNDVNGNGYASHSTSKTAALSAEYEADDKTVVERGFTVTTLPTNYVVSPGPNPYTTSSPVTTGAVAWINPGSFQLFSAGQDRYWGLGGIYAQNSPGGLGKLPIYPAKTTAPAPSDSGNVHNDDTTHIRGRESDNLTNFSGGRLD